MACTVSLLRWFTRAAFSYALIRVHVARPTRSVTGVSQVIVAFKVEATRLSSVSTASAVHHVPQKCVHYYHD